MSVQQNITEFRQTLRDRISQLGGVAQPTVEANGEITLTGSSSTDFDVLNSIVSSFAASPTFTGTASFANVAVSGSLVANNTSGTNGQILGTNGTTIYWRDQAGFANGQSITVDNINANSITSSNVTFTDASLLGTPTAPTATSGTNTTQIATTAFVTTALRAAYPIGSIYISTVSTNPSTLLGFGTWVAFGTGRMLISADGTYTAGSTGGSATTTLSVSNLPSHTHSASSSVSDPGHSHTTTWNNVNDFNQGGNAPGAEQYPDDTQGSFGINTDSRTTGISVSTSIANTGSGTAVTTISPYIAVYMWNRTA